MISDYVIIDAKGMEIADFEKSATIPGAYNIVKSAINSSRLVVLVGLYSDGKPVMPIICRPVGGDTLELRGITMEVGEDDKMTPIDSGGYELPIASYETLGCVKIGENLYINEEGLLSVPYGNGESAGVFKVGEGLEVDTDGVIKVLSSGGGATSLNVVLENTQLNNAVNKTASALLIGDYIFFYYYGEITSGISGGTISSWSRVGHIEGLNNSNILNGIFFFNSANSGPSTRDFSIRENGELSLKFGSTTITGQSGNRVFVNIVGRVVRE